MLCNGKSFNCLLNDRTEVSYNTFICTQKIEKKYHGVDQDLWSSLATMSTGTAADGCHSAEGRADDDSKTKKGKQTLIQKG